VSDEILVERRDRIATVVFNRPQVRNAFNLAMWSALPGIVEGLARDPEVRAIVFRGAGEEAFASGADISEFRENRKDRASAEAYNARTAAAAHAMETCPKPTVAMIYGYCMGGAVATALACDLRFSADTGKFGIPAGRLGIIYGLHAVKPASWTPRRHSASDSCSGSCRRPTSRRTPTTISVASPTMRRSPSRARS
jgi:enoyl-CoA hydratase/carnithine racemase